MSEFIQDRNAAVRLGKALFWDMQVGSDGIQACASCHFHAGADNRVKNQVNPGPDGVFRVPAAGPGGNRTVAAADDEFSRDRARDDAVSSQGVKRRLFVDIVLGRSDEIGVDLADPVFNVNGVNIRRVEPVNTPTVFNAAMNATNFWDGRANFYFNGENSLGISDLTAGVWVQSGESLQKVPVRIVQSSLASQAVAPPMSDFEMSYAGRTFPKLGKKMLSLSPLAKQMVDPTDSVLGSQSRFPSPGLSTPYADLIRAAFRPQYWDGTAIVRYSDAGAVVRLPTRTDPRTMTLGPGPGTVLPRPARALTTSEFTQMEANFALFFALAIQAYEETLIPNQTPYDRFIAGERTALTEQQQAGLANYRLAANCAGCHPEPDFTDATMAHALFGGRVELLETSAGLVGLYDSGFHNIAVRPTTENLARGKNDPLDFPLSLTTQAFLKKAGQLPSDIARFVSDLPPLPEPPPGLVLDRVFANGLFKSPTLRNIELTGPYFHTGGVFTLAGAVKFYADGAFFRADNLEDFDSAMDFITNLGGAQQQADLVAFLTALTDPRVRNQSAPFDHPQIFVPDGHDDLDPSLDIMREIPACGAAGGVPLTPFTPGP